MRIVCSRAEINNLLCTTTKTMTTAIAT